MTIGQIFIINRQYIYLGNSRKSNWKLLLIEYKSGWLQYLCSVINSFPNQYLQPIREHDGVDSQSCNSNKIKKHLTGNVCHLQKDNRRTAERQNKDKKTYHVLGQKGWKL